MEMEVTGYRPYEFKNDQGEMVKGVSVFVLIEGTKGVEGKEAAKLSLSEDKLNESGYYPQPGDRIDVFYNMHGRVDDVKLMEKVGA